MRARTELSWLDEKISKLEKRLAVQQSLSETLQTGSMLRFMSDRVIYDMECKLFELRAKRRTTKVLEEARADIDAAA